MVVRRTKIQRRSMNFCCKAAMLLKSLYPLERSPLEKGDGQRPGMDPPRRGGICEAVDALHDPVIHPAALPRPFSKGLHVGGTPHMDLQTVTMISRREAAKLLKAQG